MKFYILMKCVFVPLMFNHNILCVFYTTNVQSLNFFYRLFVCLFVFPSEIFLSPLKLNRPLKIKDPGSVCVCVGGGGGHSTVAVLLALISN